MLSGLLLTAAHGDAPLRTSQLHSLFWQKFHFLFLLVMIFSFLSCAGCVFLPFRLALSLTVNAAFLPALTLQLSVLLYCQVLLPGLHLCRVLHIYLVGPQPTLQKLGAKPRENSTVSGGRAEWQDIIAVQGCFSQPR